MLAGYLPSLAVLNLAWEAAHVRLYTLWAQAEPGYIAFSVLHCTLGDVMIGGFALMLVLVVTREGPLASWRWRRIAALTVFFGAGYTAFSEWMNITLLRSWAYAEGDRSWRPVAISAALTAPLLVPMIGGAVGADWDAGLTSLLFWGSLAFSLAVAAFAAFPVNRWLIARGKGHAVVHAHHGH